MSVGCGFTASAQVQSTDQKTVLLAIVKKLRASITEFEQENLCFVSDKEWPTVALHENLFCTVCPKSAEFEDGLIIGGGMDGVKEIGVFAVSVWSRISTDQLEHSEHAFLDDERGILPLKKAVLKALAGQQLYSDPDNTLQLLTEYLRPSHVTHQPIAESEDDFSSFSIIFIGPFYWDLS